MKDREVTTLIRGMPPATKQEIARLAGEAGLSMNDWIVCLLAERFKVPFAASGRTGAEIDPSTPDVLLRMPRALRRKIKMQAGSSDTTLRGVVLAVLDDELTAAAAA